MNMSQVLDYSYEYLHDMQMDETAEAAVAEQYFHGWT